MCSCDKLFYVERLKRRLQIEEGIYALIIERLKCSAQTKRGKGTSQFMELASERNKAAFNCAEIRNKIDDVLEITSLVL